MALDESNIEATRIALSGAGPIPNAVLYNNAKDLAAAMKAAGVTFGGTSDPLPIGSVVAYSGATIPTGYLDADGSSQLRASYPDLFTAIGTTYGPGAVPGTTFALPNFVGTYTNFIIKATAAAASTTVVSETLIAVPLGSLQLYAGSVYPTGWLRADGAAIGRATYAGLFAIIGTTYGAGDGSTTFNLPNLASSGTGSPVYIIKVTLSGSVEPSTVAHASSHIRAGTDVIDGDQVQIDYVPSAYTRNAAAPGAGAVTDLTAHLNGIDTLAGTHASRHIRGGADIIDGDRVQIDYVPSFYTRNAAASGAGAVTDLTAHLDGINSAVAPSLHLSSANSATVTGAASSNFAYTNATILLTPGAWVVQAQLCLQNTVTNDDALCSIYNMTTGLEVNGARGAAGLTTTTTFSPFTSAMALMNVSVNTQICPYGVRNGGSTIRARTGGAMGSSAGLISAFKIRI
jgi:microcystin-dependent protein